MCCEDMARGVDLMVFQFGVNAGIDTSAQVLQQICAVTTDGIIGPITLADPSHSAGHAYQQAREAANRVLSGLLGMGRVRGGLGQPSSERPDGSIVDGRGDLE